MKYYINIQNGNDQLDGRTPEIAWKTKAKVVGFVIIFLLIMAGQGFAAGKICLDDGSGEESCIIIDTVTRILEGKNYGEEEYSPLLRSADIGSDGGPALHHENWTIWMGITPQTDMIEWLQSINYAAMQSLLKAGLVPQPIGMVDDGYSLVPSVGYFIYTTIGGNSNPTNIVFGTETGLEKPGAIWAISNVGTPPLGFVDTENNVRLNGSAMIAAKGTLYLVRSLDNSEWFEVSRSRELYVYSSRINIAGGGTLQGDLNFSEVSGNVYVSGQLESDPDYKGSLIAPTGVTNIIFQADDAIKGVYVDVFMDTTADVFAYSNDSGVTHSLVNGTPTANSGANKLQIGGTVGNTVRLMFWADTKLRALSGTVTDGGSIGATYTLYDYYSAGTQTSYPVAYLDDIYILTGLVIQPNSNINVKKLEFYVRSTTGASTALDDFDYYLRIYTLTGTALNAVVTNATSAAVNGGDLVSSTWQAFEFSSVAALTGTTQYGAVLYAVLAGAGPDATPQNSTSHYWTTSFSDNTSVNDMANGLIATPSRRRWSAAGVSTIYDVNDDVWVRVYTE